MTKYEFALKIPYLCKADNPEVYSLIIKMLWETELSGDPRLAQSNFNTVFDRVKIGFGFMAFGDCNNAKANHCLRLAELIVICHREKHGDTENKSRKQMLIDRIKKDEALYPEISEYMTADIAVQSDGWNV